MNNTNNTNKDLDKKLQDIVKKFKELHFNKYEDGSFKIHEKICNAKNILDVLKTLTPIEKLILFYENQLENILLYRNVFPVPEAESAIKILLEQAQSFYEGILEPLVNQEQEIKKQELQKIKKLEEFMKDIDINLDEEL
jgi:uncharacterized protein YbcI